MKRNSIQSIIAGTALYAATLCASLPSTAYAQTADNAAKSLQQWQVGSTVTPEAVRTFGIDNCFKAEPIGDGLFQKMQGKSYKANCDVPRNELRHVKVLHYDLKGVIHLGELVCNQAIANDLVEIFRELYNHRYPIEKIRLIDEYDGDDERSMRDNNTSCFNYRAVPGKKTLSKHSRGMAIDINTLYNPYVVKDAKGKIKVHPATATKYKNRQLSYPYKIDRNDLCYKLFIQHGFRWGGDWKYSKDYQHFDK